MPHVINSRADLVWHISKICHNSSYISLVWLSIQNWQWQSNNDTKGDWNLITWSLRFEFDTIHRVDLFNRQQNLYDSPIWKRRRPLLRLRLQHKIFGSILRKDNQKKLELLISRLKGLSSVTDRLRYTVLSLRYAFGWGRGGRGKV